MNEARNDDEKKLGPNQTLSATEHNFGIFTLNQKDDIDTTRRLLKEYAAKLKTLESEYFRKLDEVVNAMVVPAGYIKRGAKSKLKKTTLINPKSFQVEDEFGRYVTIIVDKADYMYTSIPGN